MYRLEMMHSAVIHSSVLLQSFIHFSVGFLQSIQYVGPPSAGLEVDFFGGDEEMFTMSPVLKFLPITATLQVPCIILVQEEWINGFCFQKKNK